MQQPCQTPFLGQLRGIAGQNFFNQNSMLGHRQPISAFGLAVPSADPSQPMGDIFNLNIQRAGAEDIQPPP